MNTDSIIAELDGEIRRLTEARNLLTGVPNGPVRGRPRLVSISASAVPAPTPTAPRKSGMSQEGRKRIAEAMRKRWADRKAVVKAVKSVAKPVKAAAKK